MPPSLILVHHFGFKLASIVGVDRAHIVDRTTIPVVEAPWRNLESFQIVEDHLAQKHGRDAMLRTVIWFYNLLQYIFVDKKFSLKTYITDLLEVLSIRMLLNNKRVVPQTPLKTNQALL